MIPNRRHLQAVGFAFICAVLVSYRINPHSMIPLCSFAANLAMAFFVLVHDPWSRVHRAFFVLNLCFAIESLLLFGLAAAPSPVFARGWVLATGIGLYMIPPSSLHFALVFTKQRGRWQTAAVLAAYAAAGLFFVTAFFPPFMKEYVKVGVTYSPLGNAHYTAFLVFLGIVCLSAVGAVIAAYARSASPPERTQYKFFLLASAAALLFGGATALTSYGFEIYPPASIGFVIYAAILSYAILRHRFLDMEVFIKKGIAYFLLTAAVTLLYAGLVIAGNAMVGDAGTPSRLYLNAFAVVLLAILFEPLRGQAQAFVDSWFYRRRFDLRRALRAFSTEILNIPGSRQLALRFTSSVAGTLQTARAKLLLRGPAGFETAAEFISGSGAFLVDSPPPEGLPPLQSTELGMTGRAADRESLSASGDASRRIAEWMSAKSLDLAVPMNLKGELSGILFLGAKLSGEGYTAEEVALLETCAGQTALAMDNSSLFSETLEVRRHYEDLRSSMTSGLLTVDGEGRITDLNKAGESILGRSLESVAGMRLLDAFPGSWALAQAAESGPAGNPGQPIEIDFQAGGAKKRISATAFPVSDMLSRRVGFAVLFSDVTGKKDMEDFILNTRRLAYIGEMTSGMVNEMRAPLAEIRLHMESLKAGGRDSGFRRKLKALAIPEIDGLDHRIRDVLEFAMPPCLLRAEVDLSLLLASVLRESGPDLGKAGVEIEHGPGGPAVILEADGEKLKKAIGGILAYSAAAMTGAGTKRIRISVGRTAAHAEIEFLSTGPAAAGGEAGRTCDPFSPALSPAINLDLALAGKIIEDHGGAVTLSKPTEEGMRIAVHIPFAGGMQGGD